MKRRAFLTTCVLLVAMHTPAPLAQPEATAPAGDSAAEQQPLPTEIIERAERRLVQLDVSFKPKKAGKQGVLELPRLEASDFELVVAGDRVEIVHADRICSAVPVAATPDGTLPEDASPATEAAAAAVKRGAYVLYLEHSLLTMRGQEYALTMAEELIPSLTRDGARVMVVSSGNEWIQSPFSEEPGPLLETVAAVRKNTKQWTSMNYAQLEEDRREEIQKLLREGHLATAKHLIFRYQQDEISMMNNRMGRLSALLGALADLDAPRAVLYFADIARKNAGGHYQDMLASGPEDLLVGSSFSADFGIDRVTEQAGALGVRVYTVKARGFDIDSVGTGRMKDATTTMDSLALETGGTSFLGGPDRKSLDRVLDTIHEDLRCFYLLSFDPASLPQDDPLPVRVRFNQDSTRFDELVARFDVTTRGQIVIQSESARRESVLLAAHVADNVNAEVGARAALIPLDFRDGSFEALVQLTVANPDLPPELTAGLAWDLGMTHEFREEVVQQVSGHVAVSEPAVPVVLEALWRFKPGTSRVVSVAFESRFGQVASVHREWEWPDPDGAPATISAIVVVQPAHGVFLRKGEAGDQVRHDGSLGLGEGAALTDRPAYLISQVCRGKRFDRDLWIERKLVGASPLEFPTERWEPAADERCVLFRDLVRQLEWGEFVYEVSVYDSEARTGDPLATRKHAFIAIEPGQRAAEPTEKAEAAPAKVDPLAARPGN